jgi:SAM-dependent methyltransferase
VRVAPSLADAGFSEDEFDLAFANHVAEHVPDPVALLSELVRVLRPGGTALVAVPNAESLLARTFGAGWSEHDPSRHLQFFGPMALRSALERAGFNRVELIGRALLRPKIFGLDLKHLVERKEPNYALRALAAVAAYPAALAVGLVQERTGWRGVLKLSGGLFAVARKPESSIDG